jgi:hypothetical protein
MRDITRGSRNDDMRSGNVKIDYGKRFSSNDTEILGIFGGGEKLFKVDG